MGEHTENGAQGQQQVHTEQVEQQQPPAAQATNLVRFDPETATEAWQLARYYGQSKLIPSSLRQTGDIFVTIMAGRDFGWSPMQSMRGIYVVEGKPSLSADAMVAIVKKSGLCKYFRLVKSDDKEAIYETHRVGDPEPVRMGFTAGEAELAGLLGKKGPWATYRKRMLRNRAKSILCKEVYEDIFFGVYEEGEAVEVETIRAAEKPQKPEPLIPADHDQPPPASRTIISVTKSEPAAEAFTVKAASAELAAIAARKLDTRAAVEQAKKDQKALGEKIILTLAPVQQDEVRGTYQAVSDVINVAEKALGGAK